MDNANPANDTTAAKPGERPQNASPGELAANLGGAGVVAKLRAHKAVSEGDESFTLPQTGVVASFPRFRSYAAWDRAQQFAGEDARKVQLYYIVQVCTFDGERLKANDYAELIPDADHLAIVGRLFGGTKEKGGPGGNEAAGA